MEKTGTTVPPFIIFYNGEGMDRKERRELLRSDAFEPLAKSIVPCLECRAAIVNINLGYNGKLMEECRRLYEYAAFVDQVRHYTNTDSQLAAAVDHTVKDCIRDGVLAYPDQTLTGDERIAFNRIV